MDAAEVATGISEALLLTFEGVLLSVPAIYFYALFRNRISHISTNTTLAAEQMLRRLFHSAQWKTAAHGHNHHPRPSKHRSRTLGYASVARQPAMSGSINQGDRAEPNLVPVLDMVFQLITFFMLVFNLKAASVDLNLELPVIGSAMPSDSDDSDVMVLNINKEGRLRVYGEEKNVDAYVAQEAQMAVRTARLENPELAGRRRIAAHRNHSRRQSHAVRAVESRHPHVPVSGLSQVPVSSHERCPGGLGCRVDARRSNCRARSS